MEQLHRPNLGSVLLAASISIAGCSDTASSPDAATTDAASSDAYNTLPLSVKCSAPGPIDREVCSGTADPTSIGVGVDPIAGGIQPGAPGQHWFCRPGAGATWNGRLLLHVVGTYSDPAGDFRFAERACAQGYAAIVPMYENRNLIRGTCLNDAACYEAFHQEIIRHSRGSSTS
jgi:hypothetical protein